MTEQQPIEVNESGARTVGPGRPMDLAVQRRPDGSLSPIVVPSNSSGAVPIPLYRYLDTNGDGTGTKEAIGNYASVAEEFLIRPGAGQVFRIERMMILIGDTGTFDAEKYGNNIVLTNGIGLEIRKTFTGPVTQLDLLNGIPIKTNADWGICFDVDPSPFGVGDEYLRVRWTFGKSWYPLRLDGRNGSDADYLALILNDDLSGLNVHRFFINGWIEPS